jgi:eukaryotic-like serine/threonine-protein kinase
MSDAPDLPVGHVVGRYRIVGVLGRGGMGAVHEVEAVDHAAAGEPGGPGARRFAMKAPLGELAGSSDVMRRFAREANTTRLLDHPNLVAAVDVFVEAETLFLVMELVRGPSVADLLDAGALPPRRALVLARQTLLGLAHAHAAGVVHRDLKPENLMLVPVGAPGREVDRVKILDFGLAKLVGDAAALIGGDKLTRTGVVFGTPAYMAPEQALGRPVDGRADLYALGIVLFEMLTGERPFRGDGPVALMRAQVSSPPPHLAERAAGAPWITPAMERLIAGALAKKPAERFPDAARMLEALDEAFLSIDHLPA